MNVRGSNSERLGVSVVVRKAYGVGLYTMSGPAYDSESVITLPSDEIGEHSPVSRCSTDDATEGTTAHSPLVRPATTEQTPTHPYPSRTDGGESTLHCRRASYQPWPGR